MTPLPRGPRLSLEDPEGVALFREALAAARYSEAGIRDALSTLAPNAFDNGELFVIDRVLPVDGLLPALIRLFLCSNTLDPAGLARWIKPLTPERLESLGLVRLTARGVEPEVRLLVLKGCVLACEVLRADIAGMPADYVMGYSPTSETLANLTIRRPVRSALDLGSGNGIQSILASRHCERVVATDLNPRAVMFSAFNCLLNGAANVDCRQGSLFEPVAGETFDLVVSNPPFVVSPESRFQYRDGGRPLDDFCRTLVQECPRHLNPGGLGEFLMNWVVRPGETWSDPIRKWVAGSGCDALMIGYSLESPIAYAANWNRPLLPRPELYAERVDRWTQHFQQAGIERIASGGVVIRRAEGRSTWTVVFESPGGELSPRAGDHIVRIIEARDWKDGAPSDDDLLEAVFEPAPGMMVQQKISSDKGAFIHAGAWLAFEEGFTFRTAADPAAVDFVTGFDGRQPLKDLVAAFAQSHGAPLDDVRSRALEIVREIFTSGFIRRGS